VKDLDVLIAREPDQSSLYNSRCWTRALGAIELDKALADCETALKLSPNSAAILDSRGLVKLRQGNLAGAIADYDAALKIRPEQAGSLFGRGVAKRKQGAKAAGDLDLAAARKLQPGVDKEFAGYGVTP
jgi:tetratricopeptide (TPR) repeat protein